MAAFLGYLAQSTPVVSGPHGKLPFKGYEPGLTPPEQWDAIPLVGKLQIFGIIGMLESYGEILDVHYTNGGLPGYYPPIRGNRPELWFNLYDPFNWFDEDKDKVRGRQVEINNGRLAMLGMFSLLSESAAPGAVPPLTLLNYIVEASGITGLSVDLPLSQLPLSPLDDYTLKFISSFPSAGTGGLGTAWSQFDIFSSLPYWN